MKVLITCGPTWVKVDQVRVISNTSTGEMGHVIADAFVKQGASVTLLEGPVTHVWQNSKVRIVKYRFFNELAVSLKSLLKKRFDVVIHAAAVSDFEVSNSSKTKLDSSKAVTLKLTPTVKLIELIKKLSPKSLLVGFKLETSLTEAIKVGQQQLKQLNSNLVIANCSSLPYKACLLDRHGKAILKTSNKKLLADQLAQVIAYHIKFAQ